MSTTIFLFYAFSCPVIMQLTNRANE